MPDATDSLPSSADVDNDNDILNRPFITTKGWSLPELLKQAPNFHSMTRIHFEDPKLMQLIHIHERSGVPLIIQGFHEHASWPAGLFTLDWLGEYGKPGAFARNVCNRTDFDLPLAELIQKLRATQFYASENESERLYGKDAECPNEWATWLSTSGVLPSDLLPHGTCDYLNYLPSDVQTLMCYLGVGDTFTPFHKDLCASSGQNLMCYTENGGSSFWFMTESSAAPGMTNFFHKMNEELDFETHVVTLPELRQSNLKIYVAEQGLGDLVLVPPRSCHQVVNNGGITIKTSWSRMTLRGLKNSLYHELPIYHRVCRPETYKVKLNIYRALHHQTQTLLELQEQQTRSAHPDRSTPTMNSSLELEGVARELGDLLDLLDDVLGEEYSPQYQDMPLVSQSDTSHQDNITCDFCGADIFQSFFECVSCALQSPEEMKIGDGIVVCPLCYVEGRSCKCGTMKPSQCRHFDGLLRSRDEALHAIRAVCASIVKDRLSLLDHPNSITSARHVGVFRAACALYEKRLTLSANTQPLRTCMSKHQTPRSSFIYCRPCHHGRCMTHILETFHIHSARAILISEGVKGNPLNWHEYHKESKAEFKEACARTLHDEETGERPDFCMKLTCVASEFRTCKSVNPNATISGWYDDCIEPHSDSVMLSPSKEAIQSSAECSQGGGPSTSITARKPSLSTNLIFRRSESIMSDLTSLPNDYQGSPRSIRVAGNSDVLQSLSTTRQSPGVLLANKKKRRIFMDCVFVPRLQWDRKQEPVLSDRSTSSTFNDTTGNNIIGSMPNKDDASRTQLKKMRSSIRPDVASETSQSSGRDIDEGHEQSDDSADGLNSRFLKKQRVTYPSDGLSRKMSIPLRIEKRMSNGMVYITNKPRPPMELLPGPHSPSKEEVAVQAAHYPSFNTGQPDDVQPVCQKQLDLALAEELTTVAQSFHAQYCKMRDSYHPFEPRPVNHLSASAPRAGSLIFTPSRTEALPTEPRVLASERGLFLQFQKPRNC